MRVTQATCPNVRARQSRFAHALLLSTAACALAGVGVANAQSQAGPTTPTNPAAVTKSAGVEEVVVTARKRAEDLQTTPISVSVISGGRSSELNLRNFQDLRGLVPNLEVLPLATGGVNLTIRGIGQSSSQVNVDTKTGLYVNDFYIARQEGNQLYFYDIASTQVLKGPQGTLFGKNTTAGALLLNTALPGPDEGGYLLVRGGNYSRIDTEGAINLPLSDKFMTRLSFRTDNADGFIKHVLDNQSSDNINDKSARFQMRILPTPKLTIDVLSEYNQSTNNGSVNIVTGCNNTGPYVSNYNALHVTPFCNAYPVLNAGNEVYGGATLSIPTSSLVTDVATGGDSNSGNLNRGGHMGPFNNTKVSTFDIRMNYALTDKIGLKSITGFRRSDSQFYNPTEDVPNDIYAELDKTKTTEFTQELDLNGRGLGDRLNYTGGLFYFYQNTSFLQDTGPDWTDPLGYVYSGLSKFQSGAAFAQASYKFFSRLEFTGGVRYTYDKKDASSDVFFQQIYSAPNCNTFTNAFKSGIAVCGGSHLVGAGSHTWSSIDPRAQLSYQFTPDIFGYVSYTSGYNAGGFNQQLGSNILQGGLASYDPEHVKAYESGVKTEFFNHRLRFNIAGFYQKYSDIQTTIVVNINGINTRQVQTGATAHEDGIEGEIEAIPMTDLVFRASASYLDQAYDSIKRA